MNLTVKKVNGTVEALDVTSLVITLGCGESIEISEECQARPPHLSEGVTIWGGIMPPQGASIEELKNTTRLLGIYPLAANMIHLFPLGKDAQN